MSRLGVLATAALLACCGNTAFASVDNFGIGANQFGIDFVPISGSTNPGSGYGIVNNDYRMGVYEISNDQWNKFVNVYGAPTGTPSYAYDEGADFTGTHDPTDSVSWYEAAQFVNWLNTSTSHQPAYKFTGTQGGSDYALDTWSAAEAAGGTNLYRHKDAFYFLPTEDEWVKAAYWNGTTLQEHATRAGESLTHGNGTSGTGWNYYAPVTNPSGPWDVGSGSEELNGTYDMMGNAWEWTESRFNDPTYHAASPRSLRGGHWFSFSNDLAASSRYSFGPALESNLLGFRVASSAAVPEPGSILVWLGLGVIGLLRPKRRR